MLKALEQGVKVDKGAKAEFKPIGTGAINGQDGEVKAGLNNIDTALELFQELSISGEPIPTHD